MSSARKGIRDLALSLPPVRALRMRRYERFFQSAAGLGTFQGVFETFEQARHSAPSGAPVGFDTQEFAQGYLERFERIFSYDYPVLFWLRPLLKPNVRVFDWGGHVGVQYYSYGKYLEMPPGLKWRVCEVESVVEQGRQIAAQKKVTGLEFTTDANELDGFDILIAAGALQYIESPSMGTLLERATRKPTHLLLNKLPLGDRPRFITLQNAGGTFAPQYVFNRSDFIRELERAGYEVIDQWEDYRHHCRIPFHEDRWVNSYSGLYLRLR